MGYLVLKVAIALVLVMNGPGTVLFTGAQDTLAQQAYNKAKELADKAGYVVNRVQGLAFFTPPYQKCNESFIVIKLRADMAELSLRDLSGDKAQVSVAVKSLENLENEPYRCQNLLNEVPWQRNLRYQVAGDAQTLSQLIKFTYDLAKQLLQQGHA